MCYHILMQIRNRQGGIEMLRFIAMYFVALNHTTGYGALGWNDQLYALYIPTTWAVPLFVAISGWFGIRFSWRKIVNFASFILFSPLSVPGSDRTRTGNSNHAIAHGRGAWYNMRDE